MNSLCDSGTVRLCRPARFLTGLTSVLVFLFLTAAMAAAHGSAESSPVKGSAPKESASTSGPITITFWHAYSGPLGEVLAHLVTEFNSSQSKYKVSAAYKGGYPQVMSATVAAYRAHEAPDIAMIFDIGTATMMYAKGVYTPLHKLMQDNNIPFATSDFLDGIAGYYETPNGELDSLPFASSEPLLYYNKDMLAKIGAQPPKTWSEVAQVGHELVAKGIAKYGFSTGSANWVMFEQGSMWNGFHYATNHNGLDGLKGTKLLINSAPYLRMVSDFVKWGKDGTYYYGGRVATQGTPAQALFIAGTVGMYSDSSAGVGTITAGAKFNVGMTQFPYFEWASGAPQNSTVGGNSLWVIAGNASDVYPGVAQFLHFLTSNSAQAYWSAQTGYIPVTKAAVKYLTDNGYYKEHPDLLIPINETMNKPSTAWSRAIRLGDFPGIRDIVSAQFTAALVGKESPQEALDTAVAQGDKLLDTFATQYGGAN